MCTLGNISSAIDPGVYVPGAGAGSASVSGCTIPCGAGEVTEADYASRIVQASSRFSIYRYSGKTVTTAGNTFINCLGNKGGIFNLVNSVLVDTGSTFISNGAT